MTAPLRIAVAGCAGRMGRTLLSIVQEDARLALSCGFEHQGSPFTGKPLTSLAQIDDATLKVEPGIQNFIADTDVVIDFTTPYAAIDHLASVVDANKAMVIGTTGFKPVQEKEIEEAARHVPVVKSGNMSLGVNLVAALVEKIASSLGDEFDIEIHEAHHRYKVDAPSGTALMLGEAAAAGRRVDLEKKSVRVRDGITPERQLGDIGFSVSRAGGIVGDHDVAFASEDEIITLSHRAMDRSLFARGAVAAAKWVEGKPAGLYSMKDVLG